jgi:hypothetical protein
LISNPIADEKTMLNWHPQKIRSPGEQIGNIATLRRLHRFLPKEVIPRIHLSKLALGHLNG